MKNTTKGNLHFSYSSKSPSFLSKLRSCFRTPRKSNYGLLKPVVHKPQPIPEVDKPPTIQVDKPPTIPEVDKPVPHDKPNTTPSPSSPTKPSNPVSHHKDQTTPSSPSPTILKKPGSQHTVPTHGPKNNTDPSMSQATHGPNNNPDPSMSQAARTLASGAGKLVAGAGKLAILFGKKATVVVIDGIESVAHQIDHNEKLKETFACYYTDPNGTAYQGILHFSNNQIVFSTDLPSHTTNENCNPPILPPGSSYKTKESELKLELKISFGEVIEINQVNAENPSTRYIQIRRVQGSNYAFRGFVDYYKAYNHIYSLLPSSS